MNHSLRQPVDPPTVQGSPAASRRGLAWIWLLALLLLASACLVAALIWQLFNPSPASAFLPVGLLSKRVADYHADPRSLSFPPKEASFIEDILQDKDPYATDLPVRLATLDSVLEEPIPTATPISQGLPPEPASTTPPPAGATSTPRPGRTSTSTASATLTASATASASPTATLTPSQETEVSPTLTSTGKVTFTPTPTCDPSTSAIPNCTPTPSVTAKPSLTPSQTLGAVATVPRTPTATRTAIPNKPTFTPTPTRTATRVLSSTPTPTSTSTEPPVVVPTDTDTPVPTQPPTETATAAAVVIPTLTTCNSIPGSSLAAAADSYVDRTKPDQNFGSATTLYIRPTAGIDKRALVRFDLSSIPSGSQVLGAILYLYNDQTGNYKVNLLQVTAPWDEMGVTWNNQPAANTGSPVGSFQLTNTKCTRAANLSNALVQSWVDNPGSNYGVMLYPPSGSGDAWFFSREGSQPPQLFVVYQ